MTSKTTNRPTAPRSADILSSEAPFTLADALAIKESIKANPSSTYWLLNPGSLLGVCMGLQEMTQDMGGLSIQVTFPSQDWQNEGDEQSSNVEESFLQFDHAGQTFLWRRAVEDADGLDRLGMDTDDAFAEWSCEVFVAGSSADAVDSLELYEADLDLRSVADAIWYEASRFDDDSPFEEGMMPIVAKLEEGEYEVIEGMRPDVQGILENEHGLKTDLYAFSGKWSNQAILQWAVRNLNVYGRQHRVSAYDSTGNWSIDRPNWCRTFAGVFITQTFTQDI